MLSTQEKTHQEENYLNVRDVVQRCDDSMARTVDRGIGLQQSVGTMCAMEYLHSEGISHLIAQRVLTQPSRRRT
ncbi:MAG: hypothetical protein H7252_04315 [Cytophaga sp.]|nr:hypothetical protein [Undibacterium sp.]